MEFYNRKTEIATLGEIEKKSADFAQMTVLIGRRRVGKTTLLKNAFTQTQVLYFFIAKKNEILLCEEFTCETEEKLNVSLGQFQNFAALFKTLMMQSETKNFTLIVDEFQEFANINSAVFSEIQNIWDSYKDKSKINVIFCGSIYSMMKQIFENSKEPLFGRATAKIILKSFDIQTIREILNKHHPNFTADDMLAFYMLTGGIAKYVEQLIINRSFTKKKIFDAVFREGSFFLDEGRAVLIDEFGKDYSNYFSILSLIASGKTDRGELESTLKIAVGGYLDKLEKDYGLLKRHRPLGAKEGSRNNKYVIDDNFLNFWFRFIYKYRSAVEINNLDYVRNIVERDYETYSGLILEKYFRQQLAETKQFSAIGSYWDRRGENEIDIIAVNDFERKILFYEVKRSENRINLNDLQLKSVKILKQYSNYHVEYKKLSLKNMQAIPPNS
ncbi:MAG: ATP-binding protein [Prevotellaceae bacterium]|jgi:AAA+ ATPase superfamily predicted ATPase|nr:ATP-binding protein [Prevotellaceae bacterium]